MNPEVAARLDAVCDAFELAWKSGSGPEIGAFVASQVEDDLRRMALPHLLAVDAEYRKARDGAVPSLAEYAALLSVDPGELQQMSDDDTSMTDAAETPAVGDSDVAAVPRNERITARLDAEIRKPEIEGYEILSELGRGGMGIVYKARQIRAGRLVALKTIHAPHLAGSEQIKRFQAEAAAAGRLNHHGIVPVYEVGEYNGLHYFSMGFVDGLTLEMKAREQILSCREAAAICRDLAEALEYAHRNGVIHRDVKPHNVLIGPDDKPRLTDFGLAKLTDDNQDLTGTGQVMGTAAYMAPEQARGTRSVAAPTIDVYSLGATLYRCVTGRPPFQASTTIEVFRQLNEDEPVSPRRLNQEIDVDIETICLKCLEKESCRRFQTAGELAAELSRYLNHEPIHARRTGILNRTWRWCRRKPAIAGTVVLGLLLLFAIAGGVPYILLRESEFEIAELQSQLTADALKESQDAQAIAELKSQQAEERAASSAARAATQEYYASILQIREQRLLPDPEPGWTWKALESLQKIAASNADGKDPVVLRSLIADVLTTPDLREIGRIENVPNTGSMAVSNDGKLLAAGDWAGIPSEIRIYRIEDKKSPAGEFRVEFELVKTCSVDTAADFYVNEILEKLYPERTLRREGMHAVDFSPDDKQIAVGTRNGNVMIWQLDSDAPTLLFNKRYPEKYTEQIQYSDDGNLLLVHYEEPYSCRIFRVNDSQDHVLFRDRVKAFHSLREQEMLCILEGHVCRVFLDQNDRPVRLLEAGNATQLAVDGDNSMAVLSLSSPVLFDPLNGRISGHLEMYPDADRPRSLQVIPNEALIIGGEGPGSLTAWDAHSGRRLFSVAYTGDEVPRFSWDKGSKRIYLYSVAEMMAYELRGPARQRDESCLSTSLSSAGNPITVTTTGRQMIRSFDVIDREKRIAVLESSPLPSGVTNPIDGWTRARLIDQSDGQTVERWTCLTLEQSPRSTLTAGDSVCLLPDQNGIAFTSGTPGNIVLADQMGFRFPSGVGMDVESQSASLVTAKHANWQGIAVQETTEISGVRSAVALRIPFAFSNANQRLLLKLIRGDQTQEYSLGPDSIDAPGWYLFSLGQLPECAAGDWSLEAELVGVDAKFQTPDAEIVEINNVVIPGKLFLLPWKMMKRGSTPPAYPLRLGPICVRSDGGLAAVVESWTLNQWNSERKGSYPEYWRDFDNSEEDMHGLVANDDGVVVGTDSGLVALVHEDGQATFLEKARTETGAYDSRDGVTAIAGDEQNTIAAAGNLRGEIRLFELPAGRGVPAFVTDAHRSQIVALAISENGQRLASADIEGALKFWKRHPDRLELLFEMTANKTPIHSMKFSQNGDLFLLRKESRGLLRLELDELAAHFQNCGLAMPD